MDPGFAIYVHWPFCRSKCPYCDFNSHVRDAIDEERWRAALISEIGYTADRLGPAPPASSIFFGGGTPSLMSPKTVGAVIDAIARDFGVTEDVEVTLEANPTSAEAASFRGIRAAGVNRLSLGVQALNDGDLRALGREHSADEALAALASARGIFPRRSFDLIYARPGQTVAAWREELAQALTHADGGHLSLYQLTFEPGTSFFQARARGTLKPLGDEAAADMFFLTQDLCEAAGFPAYEISNHATPGQECRHNLTYWRYGEYAGVGPGAHGRLRLDGVLHETRQRRSPEKWLDAVEARGHGREETAPLTARTRAEELLMMGLRLREGIRAARFESVTGAPLSECLPASALGALIEGGFLETDSRRLRANHRGRALHERVLVELVAALQDPAAAHALS